MMTNIEKRDWGTTEEHYHRTKEAQEGKIYSKGVNRIFSGRMIPLHIHHDDSEEYIPQTEGLRILVVPEEEAKALTEDMVREKLQGIKPAKVGEIVKCPKGYAHALLNSSRSEGRFLFRKYT